jgi:hypothetical protein
MRHSVYKVIAHIVLLVGGILALRALHHYSACRTSQKTMLRRFHRARDDVPLRSSSGAFTCQRSDYLTSGRTSMSPVLSFVSWRSVP